MDSKEETRLGVEDEKIVDQEQNAIDPSPSSGVGDASVHKAAARADISSQSNDQSHSDDDDEEDDAEGNLLFPSARADPAIGSRKSPMKLQHDEDEDSTATQNGTVEDASIGQSIGRKRRSNSSCSSLQSNVNGSHVSRPRSKKTPTAHRRIKLDPEAQKQSELAATKRQWAHALVQRATFVETGVDRQFVLPNTDENEYRMEFYPGALLRNELLEDLIALTRTNMKSLYDGSNSIAWAWSDARKRGELRNDRMRWILLRSTNDVGIDAPESGERGILGFVAFRFTAELGIPLTYLHELQLSEKAQGRGYGRLLTELVERISRECQMQLIMLTVFSTNDTAIRFYKKMGFEIDEASPGPCYNLMDDAAPKSPYEIMSKVLNPDVLVYACDKCLYRCRFQDTLQQHAGFAHGEPWPFPCKVEGCGGGTVHAHQLQKHTEIKHTFPTSAASASSSTSAETFSEASASGSDQNYTNMRVTFQSDGRKGTVIKLDKGFYTVRMDGPLLETVTCRASAFVGHQSQPVKKKVVDADYQLALQLQYEDGWARKSTRLKKGPA